MKNKRILAKIVAIASAVCVLAGCVALFAACNKDKTKNISEIFKNRSGAGAITSYETEFTLPEGWEVYTTSITSSSGNVQQNSDVGYIKELDALIVYITEGGVKKLSVVKFGDDKTYFDGGMKGMLFWKGSGIRALRYKDGLFVCLFDDGTAGAFNKEGREVLSRTKIGKADGYSSDVAGFYDTNKDNTNIDSVIKVLSNGLIAVHYNYDHVGQAGYTSIYRPTEDGAQGTRGELVCRVKNDDGKLSAVNGFDDKYVSVTGNSAGDYIFAIPDGAPQGGARNIDPTSRGKIISNGKTAFSKEVTYIGGGKFYIHQQWEVKEGEDYTYFDGEDYIKTQAKIYEPSGDSLRDYDNDKVFKLMTNNHYDSSKANVDTRQYLNDGYTYVSYGLSVKTVDGVKVGEYDQFILDGDLNIVMSLTGNLGVHLKNDEKNKATHFDLILTGVDGNYFAPSSPGEINVFSGVGERLGHNDRSNATAQQLNDGVIVTQAPKGTSSSTSIYGAYTLGGEELVPFDYDQLYLFRGSYTVGRRYGKEGVEGESVNSRALYLIGPDGKEIAEADMIDIDGNFTKKGKPFADIAYKTTSSSQSVTNAIYAAGCYMFRVDSGEKDGNKIIYKYGVRNLDPSASKCVVMSATMDSGSFLYFSESSPTDVFVLEKVASGSSYKFVVHRLV